ncbi:DUF4037 domain-containing protein [Actinomadura rubrisoli]|uniref:DUF4037 domain-containing protein n=1 Tax=Actinomadura rubrisoli TaxID=2530368 RepID=UPI001A9D7621|nr:DUF4037 domain-containing protein [Actinomadura rubrisoli]
MEVATVAGFARSRLGVDPTGGLSVLDWLCLTGQSVLEVTAGPVFEDRTRALGPVRAALRRYPPDVERYVLAAWWRRIAEWMPIMGRAALRGDGTGARILSARIAEDLCRLGFTLSRTWAPYGKWRGTAFRRLAIGAVLDGPLAAAVSAPDWRERENAVAEAAETLLALQRERGLPAPASAVVPFWDRPYRTVDDAVPAGLLAGITDPDVAALPPDVGSVEQWADSGGVLVDPGRRAGLQAAYRAWIAREEGITRGGGPGRSRPGPPGATGPGR